MPAPTEIPIRDAAIRLGQLLKLSGLATDGGEARAAIEQGGVTVDGEVETRRGAQIRPGQLVQIGDAAVRVIAGE